MGYIRTGDVVDLKGREVADIRWYYIALSLHLLMVADSLTVATNSAPIEQQIGNSKTAGR